jgi:iron complex outermembrane receptor protein
MRESFALLENEVSGRTYVDDANTTRAPGYAVTNARIGSNFLLSGVRGTVVIGVQNLFDRIYASSLAVNAARGKYYEPASPRSLYTGVSVGAGIAR